MSTLGRRAWPAERIASPTTPQHPRPSGLPLQEFALAQGAAPGAQRAGDAATAWRAPTPRPAHQPRTRAPSRLPPRAPDVPAHELPLPVKRQPGRVSSVAGAPEGGQRGLQRAVRILHARYVRDLERGRRRLGGAIAGGRGRAARRVRVAPVALGGAGRGVARAARGDHQQVHPAAQHTLAQGRGPGCSIVRGRLCQEGRGRGHMHARLHVQAMRQGLDDRPGSARTSCAST
jgi:hypothetical protein